METRATYAIGTFPELITVEPSTPIFLYVGERTRYITDVREIVHQLHEGLRDFESNEDYLLLEALAVDARVMRLEKEAEAIKEMPLFAGLMEPES